MASQELASRSAFPAWEPVNSQHLAIDVRDTLTLASIAAAKGKVEHLRSAIREAYGVELPVSPERVEGNGIAFVWAGPDQWLAVADRGAGRDLEIELQLPLAGLAAVVDQSDARAVMRISGSRARAVLAKGVPIDLHPRAFMTNSAAITHASHIGIIIWQVDDAPTYDIALFRSFADSFAHWLNESSAEFLPKP